MTPRAETPPFDRARAHRILTRLLDRPAARRPALLARFCGKDAALRRAVARLLDAAETPNDLLDAHSGWADRLWAGWADEAAGQDASIRPGTVVGHYRIVEEIGRGGMAMVYRAERADGELVREVAFKIIRPGLDVDEAVGRFEQERQILADLNHPNIARLFDAGRTWDGRPFFVMELVEGEPIDRYCDRRQLSIEQRLDLFCVVARAVEYAHQNLVVHRDLKPSNILVDRNGEVKLLDFGIARLLDMDGGIDAAAPPAQAMQPMMTPEYASPEQVRGERVTTASDVYQLGLLLYELLSGHRPYVLPSHRLSDLERVICEQAPARLSAAPFRADTLKPVASGAAAEDLGLEAACRARRSTPARLRRRLRGDLDNIAFKALSKEPERRYGSADRLAQDIRRHRNGLPVSARASTWTYRTQKFLRRHAVGAVSAVIMVAITVAMAGFYATRIQDERDKARIEADKARQVSQFLTGLFRGADPREARGAELTARELLDRGVERIDRDLADQPMIHADLLRVLGRTYFELGVYDAADTLLTRALEVRRAHLPRRHRDVAEILGDLGELRHAQGDYAKARALLEEATAILDDDTDTDPIQTISVLRALSYLQYREFGENDLALATLERALTHYERSPDADPERVAQVLHSLGALLFQLGALERAEEVFARIISVHENELGSDHPSAGTALVSLAFVRLELGKLDGLEGMYRRGLAILEHAYGSSHPRVATALSNLGHLLVQLGRPDEAIEIVQRALAIRIGAVGAEHPDVAFPLTTLGDAYLAAGRLEQARDHYQRSVVLRERDLGMRGFDALMIHLLVRLAGIESDLGDEAAATLHLDRALAIWKNAPPSTDPRVVPALLQLSQVLAKRQRCSEAKPLAERAHQLLRARQIPVGLDVQEQNPATACEPSE